MSSWDQNRRLCRNGQRFYRGGPLHWCDLPAGHTTEHMDMAQNPPVVWGNLFDHAVISERIDADYERFCREVEQDKENWGKGVATMLVTVVLCLSLYVFLYYLAAR